MREPGTPALVTGIFATAGAAGVAGAIAIGPVTVRAMLTVAMCGVFAAWAGLSRPRSHTAATVGATLVVALTGWLALSALLSGYRLDVGAVQQAASLVALAGAVFLGGTIREVADRTHLVQLLDLLAKVMVAAMISIWLAGFVVRWHLAGPRVISLTALAPLCWLLARWSDRDSPAKAWALVTVVFIAATLSRTALACALVLTVMAFPLRTSGQRRAALVGGGAVVVTSALAIALWQPLRDRFADGDLTVGPISISSTGRLRVWRELWDHALERPVTGWGLGSSRPFSDEIVPELGHPHQDYIRLLFEGGIPALLLWSILLVVAAVLVVHRLLRLRDVDPLGHERTVLRAGTFSLVTLAITATTDNTLAYVFLLVPIGLMVGLAIGAVPSRAAWSVTTPREGVATAPPPRSDGHR